VSDTSGDGLYPMLRRAWLRGAGWDADAVRRRPVIGVCNSWSEANPCNVSLRDLADDVKRGVAAAGGLPLEFPTISLSETFNAPTSLYLRNLMAMDVEEMIRSLPVDGVVLLGGCDKTVPAQLMGAASADKPAVMITAGHRDVSTWDGGPLTIDDVWHLRDERIAGRLSDERWDRLEGCINVSPGTCNVMGTAFTMAALVEVLGMALPGTAALSAGDARRRKLAEATGHAAVARARAGVHPSAVLTASAFDNAVTALLAMSGSTNAVIHLIAIAGRVGVPLALDRFAQLSATTPVLADVRPSGPHLIEDFANAGGVPALLAELGELLDTDAVAGSDARWRDLLTERSRGPAIRTMEDPVASEGGIALLRGNLAPRGAVLKRSACDPRLWRHRGPAVVFDGEADMERRLAHPDLPVTEESVLVLRGAGPVGGPGMPECANLPIPPRLQARGVRDMVRVSDARMSGTAAGAVALHVAPESAAGGPLALVRDGDLVELDALAGRLELLVDDAELARRREAAPSPARAPDRGFARLYADHVLQADQGCDFDFLRAAAEAR
jgi:dihydroxy-acid dehydratase